MPSTEGLELLIRKSWPEYDEWINLIEARQMALKPHLDSFTLPTIGSLSCLRMENHTHAIKNDGPTVTGDKNLSIDTQGIFRVQPHSSIKRTPGSGYWVPPGGIAYPNGTMVIWGLTRSNFWMIANLDFNGEPGYKERGYERAVRIELLKVDLRKAITLTGEEPKQIYDELGKFIKELAERRKQLYHKALNMARIVEIEGLALSLINRQTE